MLFVGWRVGGGEEQLTSWRSQIRVDEESKIQQVRVEESGQKEVTKDTRRAKRQADIIRREKTRERWTQLNLCSTVSRSY